MDQLGNGREPRKLGNGSLRHAPHGCYRCSGEDRWCVIAVTDQQRWLRLCEVLGRPDWEDDPRFTTPEARLENAAELDAQIEQWTRERPPHLVMELLQEAGVAAGAVQTSEDQFLHDEHLAARGFFEHIPHLKKGEVVATGIPLGLTLTPGHTSRAGASIGEDNQYVFRDLLGLSQREFDRYAAAGAIESDG